MRFRINAAVSVKTCDTSGWLHSQVSGTAEKWKREHDIAIEAGVPKWGIDRLEKTFEKYMLTPIRNATLVREVEGKSVSSLSMLRADMRSLLLEYISSAPLVGEVADRGRNALSILSAKLINTVQQKESDNQKGNATSESDKRVEEVWRDLLVEWVGQLLTEKTEVCTHLSLSFKAPSCIFTYIYTHLPTPFYIGFGLSINVCC